MTGNRRCFSPRCRQAGAWVIALAALLSGGCGLFAPRKQTQVFIPLQKSAKEQFIYALDHRERNQLVMRNKEQKERAAEARESVRCAFKMLVDHFPEDLEVTPIARLELAEMQAGMDVVKIEVKDSDVRKSIAEFQNLRKLYPEIELVQAKSRFDEALCWKKLKEYERMQNLFKEVADSHAASEDADVKRLVQAAQMYYNQTYVK